MRVFIALFTFFSLVLANKVEYTQTPDDCSPGESSGNGHPPTTGSIGSTGITHTVTTSSIGSTGITHTVTTSSIGSTGIAHTLTTSIPNTTPVPAKNGSTPIPDDTDPSSLCNSGSIHCCETVHPSNSLMGHDLAQRLSRNSARRALSSGSIGFQCTPFALGGTSSNQCNSQVVCCTDTDFSALIAFGCNNINIVL